MAEPRSLMLTQGKFARVDAELFDWLCGYRWRAKRDGVTWYAYTGHGPMWSMHAMVLMLRGVSVPHGKLIDHVNDDGLDNRFENLRVVTPLENTRKGRWFSPFPGVGFHRSSSKWRARTWSNGKRVEKFFATQEEAIEGYRKMALDLHGVAL